MTINIDSYLSKKFKGHKTQRLASLLVDLKQGKIIPKGTLVVMASGDAKLRLKILDKDTPHKGFSTPLQLKPDALEKNVTPEYLLWYLGQEQVARELVRHATGFVFLRVPKRILYSIPIPIPKKPSEWPDHGDVVIKKEVEDEFKSLITMFYDDFRLNVKHQRYRTAIILAGAICEAMLFQLLVEYGVEKSLLDNDRQLALGKLVQYVRLLKLDKDFGVPLSHIQQIQKKRNTAIHIGVAKLNNGGFSNDDLEPFDHIVKYFGI